MSSNIEIKTFYPNFLYSFTISEKDGLKYVIGYLPIPEGRTDKLAKLLEGYLLSFLIWEKVEICVK